MTTIASTTVLRRSRGVCAFLLLSCMYAWTLTAAEIPDNAIDEDGDGYLASSYGYRIRATHPRVLLTADRLAMVVDRMYGPQPRSATCPTASA